MKTENFICFGHQGAAGYAPENTLISFEEAIKRGTDWIEFDVHRVGDELLVIHDYRLERTTNGNGIIYDKSIDYIRSLNAGKGEQIPFLHEVFDLVDRRVGINIEIKSKNTAKPVLDLINHYIQKYGWSIDNFMISSFNQFELKAVRNLNPTIKIGILMFGLPVYFGRLLRTLNPYSINISIEFVNRRFVQIAHRRGLKVFVYTVNYPDDIRRMIDMDVDGIITDYPDRAKTIISESTVKGSDENTR